MEDQFLGIEHAGFPNHPARGRIEKNVLLSQREKIRALPHLAGVHGIEGFLSCPLSGGQRVQESPLAQIPRPIEKHSAALLEETRADAEIPVSTLAPEKGIAESRQTRVPWRLEHGLIPFRPGEKLRIGGGSEALDLAKIVHAVAESGLFGSDGLYTRVENRGGAVIVHGASGETSIRVTLSGGRSKGNRQMTPVNHVLAHRVSPVHITPDGGVGVVLEKHVVPAIPVHGPVGIIHPIFRREQMILRAKRIGGQTLTPILGRTLPKWRRQRCAGTRGAQSPHEIASHNAHGSYPYLVCLGPAPRTARLWFLVPGVRRFLGAVVRFPGPIDDVSVNRVRILDGHLVMRECELRRIGETGHAFVPMAAAQDYLIPILVNIGGHITEIGNRAVENPGAAAVEAG